MYKYMEYVTPSLQRMNFYLHPDYIEGLEKVVSVKEFVSEVIYTVVTQEEFVVVREVVASPFAISHVFANVHYNMHCLSSLTIRAQKILTEVVKGT
jgi:hypothetical protein